MSIHPYQRQVLDKFIEHWKILKLTTDRNDNSLVYDFQVNI